MATGVADCAGRDRMTAMSNLSFRSQLAQLNLAAQLPQEWKAFRDRLQSDLITALAARRGSRQIADDNSLRDIRITHELLYVSDRLRKVALRSRKPVPQDLLAAAGVLLSKPNARSVQTKSRRTAEEERYVVAARVNWHKLLKRSEVARSSDQHRSVQQLLDTMEQQIDRLERLAASNRSQAHEVRSIADSLRAALTLIPRATGDLRDRCSPKADIRGA